MYYAKKGLNGFEDNSQYLAALQVQEYTPTSLLLQTRAQNICSFNIRM